MKNIEEHIRRALEEGQFDDLPGKGKPLRLDDNPYESEDWRMAHHVLRSGGFTLPWIETRNEIDELMENACHDLARAWNYRGASHKQGLAPSQVDAEWNRAVNVFREQVAALNKRIFSYNLEAPSTAFHILMLDIERELEKITREAGQ